MRVLSWYDNEWGFSNRMADTAVAMGKLLWMTVLRRGRGPDGPRFSAAER